ncbi:PucR family transcriptional regulator [Aneurinibacillus terranovensis]|uniref:PucR family transcriptional regulator n=1 Tax=Aneurinibacillus terranovensis TaxID=278991 RepID=UPI00138AC626|nr:PucR family transcriptional regulator [Aneurinibacillus terranovensis]
MPLLKHAKLAAGHLGMARRVESVNMMDAPDIIYYLKPNELLLTTAFAIKESPNDLLELVQQMAEKGCAGLGIKTKRFISEIPYSVLQLANELAFPIIEIPLDSPLGELTTQILSYILEKRTDELRYALETHQAFSRIIMEGKGMLGVMNSLSTLIQHPVLLFDHRGQVLAESYATPSLSQDKKKMIVDLLKSIRGNQVCYFSLLASKEPVTVFLFEIYQQRQGFLVVLETMLDDPFSVLAVEQAANVVRFEFMKQYALEESSRRIKNEFFADFLDEQITSEEEIMNRGRHYGLQKRQTYKCIVALIDDSSEIYSKKFVHREEAISQFRDQVYEYLDDLFSHLKKPYILFTKGHYFVLLIPVAATQAPQETEEQDWNSILRNIQDKLYEELEVSLSFGIGNYAEQLTDIPACFHKALEALRSGYQSKKTRFIQSYRVKELVELLRMIPYKNLKQFYDNTLKGLADSTDREHMDLIQTIAVYLENNCLITETAKQLYIHRNTVSYRLNKCEEILGRSLKDPNEALKLRIALMVRSLLQT